MIEQPQYDNDCPRCKFVGRSAIDPVFDLYWCNLAPKIRYNNERYEYAAGYGYDGQWGLALIEAFHRASAEGLVPDHTYKFWIDFIENNERTLTP
jgi:hypothetical protein